MGGREVCSSSGSLFRFLSPPNNVDLGFWFALLISSFLYVHELDLSGWREPCVVERFGGGRVQMASSDGLGHLELGPCLGHDKKMCISKGLATIVASEISFAFYDGAGDAHC
jgi:hypothetical protein